MKIQTKIARVLRFAYHQEPEDSNYGSCLWAIFDIDPDNGMLNIQSDCGNYAHRWPEHGIEFLKLLSGMHEDYLIHKLCGEGNIFNEDETISSIEEYLNDAEIEEKRKKYLLGELRTILSGYGMEDVPELATHLIDEWNNDYSVDIDCVWELVETDYNLDQKKIIQIFTQVVKPELKRLLMRNDKVF